MPLSFFRAMPTRSFAAVWFGAAALVSTACAAAESAPDVRAFLTKHCVDCHGADQPKAGLRLDTLTVDVAKPEQARAWTKILDRIESGEMPPKDSPRPPQAEQVDVTQWINGALSAADRKNQPPAGALVLRRMNRLQYENTIRDLFSIKLDLQDRLPPDSRAFGFDNVGAALSLSSAQLEAYLEAADAVLDHVIVTKPKPVGLKQRQSGLSALNEITTRRNGGILELEDVAIGFGRLQFYASRDPAPVDGTYRVRVSQYAYHSDGKPVEIYVRSRHKTGDRVIGFFQVPPDVPTVLEFTCDLKKDAHVVFETPKFRYVPRKRLAAEHTDPGLALQWIEFEGPLLESWPPAGHRQLFGDLPIVMVNNYLKLMSVQSEQPAADAERLLTSFMRQAYRRPVTPSDVEPILSLVKRHLDEKQSFEESMRVGYKAVLCSPDFLFFQDTRGDDDQFALASRLSYFLWNTRPDEQLLTLAERGELSKSETLRAQTERLLKDPRSRGFVENFLGQWLDLRLIDFTTPDRKLYPEFDTPLEEAMVAEIELFFREVLENDLSLTNFVDSDFTYLNERLATHYGIADVKGPDMRRVALPADTHRGGVVTMASVLKVTANGSYTHPVHRGVWMLRNIVGRPPDPPPPNAGAVEPDLRGAKTIREQLNIHRQDAACAGCHTKIDPLGFALENFDVTGMWRENYRVLSGEKLTLNKNGPAVEAAYELPDGRPFKDVDQLKQLLLEDKDRLARCLAEKLLIYGTGRGLTFSDRETVKQIVARNREQGYGFRSLIHDVVQSEIFQNK
jgi:hypothetical protein